MENENKEISLKKYKEEITSYKDIKIAAIAATTIFLTRNNIDNKVNVIHKFDIKDDFAKTTYIIDEKMQILELTNIRIKETTYVDNLLIANGRIISAYNDYESETD
jgi:hypothetical protein